jgi:DNA-binding CsgD family transcriptional regulator
MNQIACLEETAVAAFVTADSGCLVAWNAAAECLLGLRASDVVGRRCDETVGGRDHWGNMICVPDCVVRQMARRREPIHPFEIHLPRPSGDSLCLRCSIVVLPGGRLNRRRYVHLVEPVAALCAPSPDRDPGQIESDRPADGPPVHQDAATEPLAAPGASPVRLTERERTVLRMLAAGIHPNEIARSMGISTITVRNHAQHILQKLDAHNRLQAIVIAHRDGLI